jgi:hypothetical protein
LILVDKVLNKAFHTRRKLLFYIYHLNFILEHTTLSRRREISSSEKSFTLYRSVIDPGGFDIPVGKKRNQILKFFLKI